MTEQAPSRTTLKKDDAPGAGPVEGGETLYRLDLASGHHRRHLFLLCGRIFSGLHSFINGPFDDF